jgi:hypothetical protein
VVKTVPVCERITRSKSKVAVITDNEVEKSSDGEGICS